MNENSSSFLLTKCKNYSIIIIERVRDMNEELEWYKNAYDKWVDRYYTLRVIFEDLIEKTNSQNIKEELLKTEKENGWY